MIISGGKKVLKKGYSWRKEPPQSPIYSRPGPEAWSPQGEKTKS